MIALASLSPKSSRKRLTYKNQKKSYLVRFKSVDGAIESLLEDLSASEDDNCGRAEFDTNLVKVKLEI